MAGNIQEATDHLIRWRKIIRDRYDERVSSIEQRMTPVQQRLFAVFRFLTAFTLLALPFYAVLNSGWNAELLRSVYAAVSANLLSVVGLTATSSGSFIHGEQFIIDVTRDSTGWKSLLAFTALVFASGRSFRKTVYGVLFGVVIIFFVNVLRITSMFYAVAVYQVEYELLHTVLWRWGLTVVVLVTWLVWLNMDKTSSSSRFTAISRLLADRF